MAIVIIDPPPSYSREQLVRLAETYLARAEIGISTLGRLVVDNDKFFIGLQRGRDCKVSSVERASDWFNANWPRFLAWPDDVPDRRQASGEGNPYRRRRPRKPAEVPAKAGMPVGA
jgi:hypothetical protein